MHAEPPAIESGPLAAVPVFPLPNVVLFPGVVLPLHIFEPRYQQMLRDVMAGSRHFVLARTEAERPSGVADVGCLAEVVRVQRDAAGQSNILVRGTQRVQLLAELAGEEGYRRFRAQALPPAGGRAEPLRSHALANLQHVLVQLGRAAHGRDPQLSEILRASADPLVVMDFLAASVVRDPARQQAILAAPTLTARFEAILERLGEALLQLEAASLRQRQPN